MRKKLSIQFLVSFIFITLFTAEVAAAECMSCCEALETTKEPGDVDFIVCDGKLTFNVKLSATSFADIVHTEYKITYSYNGAVGDVNNIPGWYGLAHYIYDNTGTSSFFLYSGATANVISGHLNGANWAGFDFEFPLPSLALEKGGFKIRVQRESIGVGTVSNCSSYDGTNVYNYSSEIPTYTAPSSFSATNGTVCDAANLTWVDPSDQNICLFPQIQIQKKLTNSSNWNPIATVSFGVESYSDPLLDDNTYDYRVRATHQISGSPRKYYSPFTPESQGKRKPLPGVVSNPTASVENCDGTIDLAWTPATGADSYTIEWSAGGATEIADSVTNTTYKIDPIVRGQNYDITITSVNTCGNSDTIDLLGLSPGGATAATGLVVIEDPLGLKLTWVNGDNVETISLVKSISGEPGTVTIPLTQDTTDFTDTDVQPCKEYIYSIVSDNLCNSPANSTSVSGTTSIDLSNTFDPNAIDFSKGYYTNRVELQWSLINNANQMDGFNIFRKILGVSGTPALLNSLNNPNSNIYLDYLADAGVLYEYSIVGYGSCIDSTLYSDTIKGIGFKSATGIINGDISYTGGIAVEGVKVLVENVSPSSGSSLQFNGTNRAQNLTPSFDNNTLSALTVEAWVKLDAIPTGEWSAISDCEGIEAIKLGGDATNIFFSVKDINGLIHKAAVPDTTITLTDYNHFAGVFGETAGNIKFYLNGNLVAEVNLVGAASNAPLTSICLGDKLNGKLEEARFWNIAKDSAQILNYFNIKSNNTEAGLKAVWNFDESVGNFAYDQSHSGPLYNKNHCQMTDSPVWSSDIPTSAQLGLASYTNTSGNYYIIVPYTGIGENFTVTPIFGTHAFNPSNQVLFIGDGSTVHNNINFEDNSSFQVTGTLSYKNTTCPVKGAYLKIDGNIVVSSGVPVETDAQGKFDIQVPIGAHVVTVEKSGHVFNAGRWPLVGTHDFQEPVTNIKFSDSTLVKVIGRVVGGLRESAKFPGLGRSKNNIGVAKIIFTTQSGCHADTIFTNSATGEYEAFLLPTKHIVDLGIENNSAVDFGPLDLLDLDLIPPMQMYTDSAQLVSPQSVSYQKLLNYTHRTVPKIEVFGNDSSGIGLEEFKGDRSMELVDYSSSNDATSTISLWPKWPNSPFLYDVFTQKHTGPSKTPFKYRAFILAYEEYKNFDNNTLIIDTVPVSDGKLLINNELALFPVIAYDLSDINPSLDTLRYAQYDFEVGSPNFNSNASISQFSYTKTMTISIETPLGEIITWKPLDPVTGQPDVYRAYLLGSQNFGNSFLTFGPEIVDFVLRDPPGGESFATRAVGESSTVTESWGWNLGLELTNTDEIDLGVKMQVGIGVSTETDIEQNVTVGTSATISGGHSGSLTRTIENISEWSTNSSPDNIGSGSDLFVGHSKNVEFGVTDYLRLVPDSMCTYVECENPISGGSGYKMAKTSSLSIVPRGYNTGFIYTQNFIESQLLPSLKNFKNTYLQSSPKYTSILPVGDANYGKNNDDPVFEEFATLEPSILNYPEDFNGVSYTYTPVTLADSLIDTLRIMNQQIALWEKAIWDNEYEKVNIDNVGVLDALEASEDSILTEKYAASNAAYFALEAVGGVAAVGTAVAAAVGSLVPLPGYATAQSIGFIATTVTSIAATETIAKRLEYLDKAQEIQNRFANIIATNYSISGGATFTNSISSERTITDVVNIDFGASANFGLELSANISNTGLGVVSGLSVDFDRSSEFTNDSTTSNAVLYTLSDGDNGDYFSVDIFPSLNGWGPIFKRRAGGQTACPHEPAEVTKFYMPGTIINEGTLQRDLPGISVDLPIITNIPIDEAAVFNLTVSNNTQTGDDMPYSVTSLTAENPFGAIIMINGGYGAQTAFISAGTSINMTVSVQKGPGAVYDYDSLLVIVHSVCQYDFGAASTFIDVADSVYISAHFLPTCTDAELLNPADNWVLNNSYTDTFPVEMSGYNINFFDLERFRLEYKSSSTPDWNIIQSFWKDTTGQPTYLPIPTSSSYTSYDWLTNEIPDGDYDLRVTSLCSFVNKSSLIYSGTMDRINPHSFGTPSPADGILDPNDDISIRFNEPIDLGSISPFNFDVRGVLNSTELRHSTSLYFNGIDAEVLVTGGVNIQNRDFTIEFWAKRDGLGEQVIFSQGASGLENLSIGFDAADKFSFKVGTEELTSTNAIVNTDWHHYSVSYNYDNETVELFMDGSLTNTGTINFYPNFTNTDALIIGKNAATNSNFFKGNLHEVRVWNVYRSLSDIAQDMNIELAKSSLGLLYNWKMDEANGLLVKDHVRRRDGITNGAAWQVNPNGNAISLDGVNDYLQMDSVGNVAITDEMDFTLEFWFNSNSTNPSTLFSNGTGTGLASDSLTSWTIDKDALGKIHVRHNGFDFVAVDDNYFDGEWHHFAIVFQRTSSLSAYIDGNIQNIAQANNFDQLGGSKMFLGARGYYQGSTLMVDNFSVGMFDEFRFWNTARKVEQVSRDKQNRLLGDELGLVSYFPFEKHSLVLGVPILTPSLADVADNGHTSSLINGALSVNTTPTIKLQRPIQAVNFTYSLNGDEIIITPTSPNELIENVTLDVTVAGLKDLNGNYMQSPKTWIAYIDKNQIVWQDDVLSFEKDFGATLSFTTAILNNGGSAKVYDVTNLPDWLTASHITGSIAPNSVEQITFTIDADVNIGDYLQDLHLLTDFGFSEKLTIALKVRTPEPTWTVDPTSYTNSMSIIGYVEINDVVSANAEDMLGVFVNDVCRGVAHLEYVPQLDRFLVFLDVYSNLNSGENLSFKVWDASSGTIFSEITPNTLSFVANHLIGSISAPQLFKTSYEIEVAIPLNNGWNWISHFLLNPDSLDLDKTLGSLEAVTGDEIKGISNFSNYLNNTGWVGSLNTTTGIIPEDGYKLKVSQIDTLIINGDIIDPTSRVIDLAVGWNWVGYVSVRNQSVIQALGNLNPTEGDIIKAQSQFAVYDNLLGWVGSLQTMKPGTGYMYYTTNAASFVYPAIGQFKFGIVDANEIYKNKKWVVNNEQYASNMTIISSLDTDCEYIENNTSIAVGVFDEEANCRAVNLIENLEENQYSFLTVGGKNSTKLRFGILDTKTGRSYDLAETINFSSNQREGKVSEPFMLKVSDEICFKMQFEKVVGGEEETADTESEIVSGRELIEVYPTLFEDKINVYFYTNAPSEENQKVKLYNLWGQLVYEQNFTEEKGYNKVTFDVSKKALPIGVYHLIVSGKEDKVHSFKVVKK